MAARLVVFKTVRPSTDVPFFQLPEADRTALRQSVTESNARGAVGERIYGNGLKKVRTLFFPTIAHFNAWNTNSAVAQAAATRQAYNEANGITETRHEVALPNYTL